MFDLPRKVREFSCMCCGERFWTTQGEARVSEVEPAPACHDPNGPTLLDFHPSAHLN